MILAPSRALSIAYRAGLALKNLAYDRRLIQPKRLSAQVISIGNLSVGGAGKTPLAIYLAKLLTWVGVPVDVLSRGYGRTSRRVLRVDPGDPDGLASFGDEPLLVTSAAGVPVYVGASRWQAGLLAEQQGPRVHLLDDGFQHRRLHRDLDIVVLHRSDFSARLLPAGRLREPLAALRRASVVVLRSEDRAWEPAVRALGLTAPVWFIQRRLVAPALLGKAVAFCGIAHPKEFFRSLPKGARLATRALRDHHRYTEADLRSLVALARQQQASAFVTTEKDLVRLSPAQRALLEAAAPLRVARLEVVAEDEAAVVEYLRSRLSELANPTEPV